MATEDVIRTIRLRCQYILGACKDTAEMKAEARAILELLDAEPVAVRAEKPADSADPVLKPGERIEVMESFLRGEKMEGDPEPPADTPACWMLWCRVVRDQGRGKIVVSDFIHTIDAPDQASAKKKLEAYMVGKTATNDEW